MSDFTRDERVIRAWLAESDYPGSTDRVADAVLDAIPRIAQESRFRSGRALRMGTRLATAAAAVVLATIGVSALLLRGTQTAPGISPPAPTAPAAPATMSPSPSPSPSLPPGVTAIEMGSDTWSLAVDDRSVWVQVGDVGIGRIDRAQNTDTGQRVPEVPAMQFEGTDLWALDEGTGIVRLDSQTGAVLDTIPGISGAYIVVDGTTAWVADVGHSVDRVNLKTGKVVATINVPAGPKEMVVLDGSVWVVCDTAGIVARIDTATNKVVAQIPGGVRPGNLAAGEGAVWVWNHGQELLRIDPSANKVVARIPGISETLGAGVAVGGGFVWAAVPTGIGRIDPNTNSIVDVIPLGEGGYVDLAWFDGDLWASSTDRHVVYRIDPDP